MEYANSIYEHSLVSLRRTGSSYKQDDSRTSREQKTLQQDISTASLRRCLDKVSGFSQYSIVRGTKIGLSKTWNTDT